MKRRTALKNIGLATGGMLLFPGCDFSDEKVGIILNKLKINTHQEALLRMVVDTLLPEGETPGGLSVKAHNFVWTYIDDCTSPEDQERFISSLNLFDAKTKEILAKRFETADETDRLATLETLIEGDDDPVKDFIKMVKGLSVWCYMNSEYIMTQEMPYQLIPGANTYIGCKQIDTTKRINING